MYAVLGFASRDFSLSPHPAKSNAAKTIRNDRVLIRRKSERNKLSSTNRQATWCPVPEIAGILPEGETYRRVGVSAFARHHQFRRDLLVIYSRVEKQSYFPRRPYANTPTRSPSRSPKPLL